MPSFREMSCKLAVAQFVKRACRGKEFHPEKLPKGKVSSFAHNDTD
jgi:hypothetical protein